MLDSVWDCGYFLEALATYQCTRKKWNKIWLISCKMQLGRSQENSTSFVFVNDNNYVYNISMLTKPCINTMAKRVIKLNQYNLHYILYSSLNPTQCYLQNHVQCCRVSSGLLLLLLSLSNNTALCNDADVGVFVCVHKLSLGTHLLAPTLCNVVC